MFWKFTTLQIRLYESFVSQVKAWNEEKNKKYQQKRYYKKYYQHVLLHAEDWKFQIHKNYANRKLPNSERNNKAIRPGQTRGRSSFQATRFSK